MTLPTVICGIVRIHPQFFLLSLLLSFLSQVLITPNQEHVLFTITNHMPVNVSL